MIKYLIAILLLISTLTTAQSSIKGHIYDSESLAALRFATVALLQDGRIIKGVETDQYGYFEINEVKAGKYELEASFVGYYSTRIKCNVKVNIDSIVELNIKEDLSPIEFCNLQPWQPPMIDFKDTSSGMTLRVKDIKNMAIPK